MHNNYIVAALRIILCRESVHLINKLQPISHLSMLKIQDVTMDRYCISYTKLYYRPIAS